MINRKEYLGDSVYIQWDGYIFKLTTENGFEASNTIALEPEVVKALEVFVVRVRDFVNNYKQVT